MPINPGTRTVKVLPSADGVRYFAYPDGDYQVSPPIPNPDYTEDWSQFSISTTYSSFQLGTNIFTTQKTSAEDPLVFTFSATTFRGSEAKSLKIRNDGGIYDNQGRHRCEVVYNMDSFSSPRLSFNTEYWFGYSVCVLNATDMPTGSVWNASILQQTAGSLSGPTLLTTFYERGYNGHTDRMTLAIQHHWGTSSADNSTEYYYKKSGPVNTTVRTDEFYPGRWYDIIYRVKYAPDTTNGFLHVWVVDKSDGTTTKVVELDNVQFGFSDRADPNLYGLFHKNGSYWGTADRTGRVYTVHIGPWRQYQGTNGYNVVAPRGTPTP